MKSYKYLLFTAVFAIFFFLFGCVGEGTFQVGVAFYKLCGTFMSILPIALMLLVVLAAIVYAVGQVMGAETRARATVWATNMIAGAIVGALIFIIVPYVLDMLAPDLGMGTAKKWCSLLAAYESTGNDDGEDGGPGEGDELCGGNKCSASQLCVNNQCVYAGSAKKCYPSCKSGYTCVQGKCVQAE